MHTTHLTTKLSLVATAYCPPPPTVHCILCRLQSQYPVQITVTVSCVDHRHCILCRSPSLYPLPGSICPLAWIPCPGHNCCILCFDQSPYSQSRSQSLCPPFTLAPVAPGWHPTWAISTTPAKWLPLLQHHHTIKRQSNSMMFIANAITTCIFTQFGISE